MLRWNLCVQRLLPGLMALCIYSLAGLSVTIGLSIVAGCRPDGKAISESGASGNHSTKSSSSIGSGGVKPAETAGENGVQSGPQSNQSAQGELPSSSQKSGAGQKSGNSQAGNTQADSKQETSPMETAHPFAYRQPMPEFPDDVEWLNAKPMKLADLRGKFVLLDFWTYCCINCMHILPELKKLEQKYANQLVVIGVHSAKFDTEKVTENIAAAILRYDIEHPVFNDPHHKYWTILGVSSWPTTVLIDPEGQAIWARAGEIEAKDVEAVLQIAIPYYRGQGLLDERPLHFPLLAVSAERKPLRFPGKLLADAAGNRLFISDSNHNRIVITTLDGQLVDIIGSGRLGAQDGTFEQCSFNKPQGLALHGNLLYVADTENHLIRKVDLSTRQVTTVAGTGVQGRIPWPGLRTLSPLSPLPTRWVGPPLQTELNSPWDLCIHDGALYVAMAGPHQIWRMPLDESEIGPYAGNAREDIVDGPLLPERPYELGSASFAQPSGLSTDGTWLYVADSEGSSIRAVPFDPTGMVRTVVGTAHLPYARLFAFGDRDGKREEVLLQHPLAVLYHEGKLYVADTYNHKIKVVDAETGETRTLAGTGQPGCSDDPPMFYEPAGLAIAGRTLYVADTNNHRICTIDLDTGRVATLEISGLTAPPRAPAKPDFAGAVRHELPPVQWRAADNQVHLRLVLDLPLGWKLNPDTPLELWVEAEGNQTGLDASALGHRQMAPTDPQLQVTLPAAPGGSGALKVSLIYYYCEVDGGLCRADSVVWQLPYQILDNAGEETLLLRHTVK